MNGPQAGDRISEYVLDERVGSGSYGEVWRARHHIWKNDVVAVKIPTDSRFVRNLQKEGCTIHGLRHPNIVRAIGLDPYADIPYLIMEYVDGASLGEWIRRHPGGLPTGAAQRIVTGMLRALDHAHSNGVIHRDIKPANILIAGGAGRPAERIGEDEVKVTDFGLGLAGQETSNSIVQSGEMSLEDGRSISGTIAYMAPEQRDGGMVDAKSDLYSAGIVLFEMLIGERPSGGDMPSQLRADLPPWVDEVFSRLYARRDRRFESAAAVLEALEPRGGRGVYPSPPPIPPEYSTRRAGRGGTKCAACGAPAQAGDNFCIYCGHQIAGKVRRCPACDGYPGAEDVYCIECGARLSGA